MIVQKKSHAQWLHYGWDVHFCQEVSEALSCRQVLRSILIRG